MAQRLVLASSSRYRRELLSRLQLPFEVDAPEADETPLPGEEPPATARRLARVKADIVAARQPDALVIGSDQVAVLDGEPLGKPLTLENARRQLGRMSGREVTFHTALCVVNAATGSVREGLIPYTVRFRPLTPELIERYLAKEQPLHCAGSARCEGLGISLIAQLQGDDPNALVGLPLIALIDMLNAEGLRIP